MTRWIRARSTDRVRAGPSRREREIQLIFRVRIVALPLL
jgi:hypothetical protein